MKEFRRIVILAVMLCFASVVNAQEKQVVVDAVKEGIEQVSQSLQAAVEYVKSELEIERSKKLMFKPYGFVRNFVCYDSRQNLHAMGDTFNIIPLDELMNEDGTEDLNATSELTFVAFTTRLGLDIGTSYIGKMATSAKIEADFCGYGTNNTMFRIRQAYVKLAWEKSSLTIGQSWHPMAIQVLPTVVGFSPGVPLNQFNRSPQVSWNVDMGKGWNLLAAAIYQHPNTSVGPNGATYDYSRWSKIPELYASIKHKGERFMIGVGVDYLSIMPRKTSTIAKQVTLADGSSSMQSVTVRVNDRVTGISPEVFANYKSGKTKAMQALFGLIMRELKGTGDPVVIRDLLQKELDK